MDISDSKKKPEKKGKKPEKGKKESKFRWAIQVFFISVALSAVLTLASDQALDGAGLPSTPWPPGGRRARGRRWG